MRRKTPKQPRKPQKTAPLKVNVVYAPPSKEADERWLAALKILLEAAPEEEKDDDHQQRR